MPRQPDDVRSRGQNRHPAARPRLPFLTQRRHYTSDRRCAEPAGGVAGSEPQHPPARHYERRGLHFKEKIADIENRPRVHRAPPRRGPGRVAHDISPEDSSEAALLYHSFREARSGQCGAIPLARLVVAERKPARGGDRHLRNESPHFGNLALCFLQLARC